LCRAQWWAIAAKLFAEWAPEELPCDDHERRGLTGLLSAIRLGDASLVSEYREWRQRQPDLTRTLALAGRRARPTLSNMFVVAAPC
jgi:hypothetical protein